MGELVHDLNNEVMALQGWATLARGEMDAGRLPHTEMDRVLGISDSMARMLRDILDTVAGRALSPEVTFDPLALTEKTIGDRIRNLSSVTLRLHSSLPDGTAIRGRSSFWVRILSNLLANATRHALSQISVSLSLEVTEHGAHMVVLRVEDDGAGISLPDRQSIFDPLWRGESGDIGLGLSSVQWAVEQLNGAIRYHETPLGGAAFEIHVPAAPRPAGRRGSQQPAATGMEALWDLRFLILHGDPVTREALHRMLHTWGVETHEMEPTEEPHSHLLEEVRGLLPDIVLLDPGSNECPGLEIWNRMRGELPHLAGRVIFVCCDSLDEQGREQVLRTGQPLLSHPFDMRELARTVMRLSTRQ